jgi:serine palmitoyltransferase
MDEASRALVHYATLATRYVDAASSTFRKLPGSAMFSRYIKSSYQNDPARSVIELALAVFLLVYVLRSRFSTDKNRVILTDDVSTCDMNAGGGLSQRELR